MMSCGKLGKTAEDIKNLENIAKIKVNAYGFVTFYKIDNKIYNEIEKNGMKKEFLEYLAKFDYESAQKIIEKVKTIIKNKNNTNREIKAEIITVKKKNQPIGLGNGMAAWLNQNYGTSFSVSSSPYGVGITLLDSNGNKITTAPFSGSPSVSVSSSSVTVTYQAQYTNNSGSSVTTTSQALTVSVNNINIKLAVATLSETISSGQTAIITWSITLDASSSYVSLKSDSSYPTMTVSSNGCYSPSQGVPLNCNNTSMVKCSTISLSNESPMFELIWLTGMLGNNPGTLNGLILYLLPCTCGSCGSGIDFAASMSVSNCLQFQSSSSGATVIFYVSTCQNGLLVFNNGNMTSNYPYFAIAPTPGLEIDISTGVYQVITG